MKIENNGRLLVRNTLPKHLKSVIHILTHKKHLLHLFFLVFDKILFFGVYFKIQFNFFLYFQRQISENNFFATTRVKNAVIIHRLAQTLKTRKLHAIQTTHHSCCIFSQTYRTGVLYYFFFFNFVLKTQIDDSVYFPKQFTVFRKKKFSYFYF